MIKTERQYATTRVQLDRLRAFLQDSREPDEGVDPRFLALERRAIESQMSDLEVELEAYEALRSGRAAVIPVTSLEELPRALISARIARGWTQAQLAHRLGMAEQQIQRYEATDFAAASFARLVEVARALEVDVPGAVVTTTAAVSQRKLFERLREIGWDRDLVFKRLLPPDVAATLQDLPQSLATVIDVDAVSDKVRAAVARAGALVARVIGVDTAAFFSDATLAVARTTGRALYKQSTVQAERDQHHRGQASDGYTLYAHYLSLIVLEAHSDRPTHRVPNDPRQLRAILEDQYRHFGGVSLPGVLHLAWDYGIPVIPLSDSGRFHGACWRSRGRNVIVLKQRTRSLARWTFDLLHELRHTSQHPTAEDFSVVERESTEATDDEVDASIFAGDVLLDGRAEELVALAVSETGERVDRLKAIVPRVAQREGVAVDALANYMAYRLSLQGLNWWGAANNMQVRGVNPFEVARDVFLERADLARLNPVDRDLLLRALTEPEETSTVAS